MRGESWPRGARYLAWPVDFALTRTTLPHAFARSEALRNPVTSLPCREWAEPSGLYNLWHGLTVYTGLRVCSMERVMPEYGSASVSWLGEGDSFLLRSAHSFTVRVGPKLSYVHPQFGERNGSEVGFTRPQWLHTSVSGYSGGV